MRDDGLTSSISFGRIGWSWSVIHDGEVHWDDRSVEGFFFCATKRYRVFAVHFKWHNLYAWCYHMSLPRCI